MVDNNKYPCDKSVVEFYKGYSTKNKIKDTVIHGCTFTLDDRYKILEKSDIFFVIFFIFYNSWIRCIWYCCCSYRLGWRKEKINCNKKNRKSF